MAEWYKRQSDIVEHLVYLNSEGKELEKLLNKEKTMIIRGGQGRACPLGGRVKVGEAVYFVQTGGNKIVSHRAIISKIIESEKMTPEETIGFLEQYKKELNLSPKQYEKWSKKRYLAVFEISGLVEIVPFEYRRDSNMDSWLLLTDINNIRVNKT